MILKFYKLKTSKSALKRIKILSNSLIRKPAYTHHFLRRRSVSQLQKLKKQVIINKSNLNQLYKLLPYI